VKATRILAILATAAALGLSATGVAQAAPIQPSGPLFLNPDTNWTGPAGTLQFGPGPQAYSIHVDSNQGGIFSTNFGNGFVLNPNSTLDIAIANNHTGSLDLDTSQGHIDATLIRSQIFNGPTGQNVFGLYRVDTTTMQGVHVGALLGADAFTYRIQTSQGVGIAAKGDVAPVVPEPATLSLVLLGLGGLTASARRKLGV